MQRYINKIILLQWCLILSILYIFSRNTNNNNNRIFVQAIQDSYNPEEEESQGGYNDGDDDDDFMFSSDKRTGALLESEFYIRVLLVGFSNDGQQQISLPINTIEEHLQSNWYLCYNLSFKYKMNDMLNSIKCYQQHYS